MSSAVAAAAAAAAAAVCDVTFHENVSRVQHHLLPCIVNMSSGALVVPSYV